MAFVRDLSVGNNSGVGRYRQSESSVYYRNFDIVISHGSVAAPHRPPIFPPFTTVPHGRAGIYAGITHSPERGVCICPHYSKVSYPCCFPTLPILTREPGGEHLEISRVFTPPFFPLKLGLYCNYGNSPPPFLLSSSE